MSTSFTISTSIRLPRVLAAMIRASCVAATTLPVHALTKEQDYDQSVRYSQQQLVDLFEKTCLAHFPDAAKIAKTAQSLGFSAYSKTQWSIGNTSVNIVASSSGRDISCAVDGRQVSVGGLANQVAQRLGKFQPSKLKVRAGGRRLEGRVIVNSTKAKIRSAPSGGTGSPFSSATISINRR